MKIIGKYFTRPGRKFPGEHDTITIETLGVYGIEGAIRALRAPLQSYDKSDSGACDDRMNCEGCSALNYCNTIGGFENYMGIDDLNLALKLARSGPDHSKYLRMIHVQTEIVAPVYFFQELDTYKVGTTRVSSSLQHTGAKNAYNVENIAVDVEMKNTLLREGSMDEPEGTSDYFDYVIDDAFQHVIDDINRLRELYLETGDYNYFRAMRQLMPMGFKYTVVYDCNYQVLRNIYAQRKTHKLEEWQIFCEWIESLPYSTLITAKSLQMAQ